jgi:(S)-mandelate dehydrogenase
MLQQGGGPQLVNLARSVGVRADISAQAHTMSRQMDMTMTWQAVDWLRQHWHGRILVKGILSVEDALLAKQHEVDGIVLSNHGGRQLSSAPSAIELLPHVKEAVGNGFDVMVDGGVHRGSDIIKAKALGASAVLLGRAPLYGLASCGAKGVANVLRILRNEYEITLRLLGLNKTADLDLDALSEDCLQCLRGF